MLKLPQLRAQLLVAGHPSMIELLESYALVASTLERIRRDRGDSTLEREYAALCRELENEVASTFAKVEQREIGNCGSSVVTLPAPH